MTDRIFELNTKNIEGIGTLGHFICPLGMPLAQSVEREWLNNEKNVSCIPAGTYELVWRDSAKHGRRLHVINENVNVGMDDSCLRTHCLIHVANYPREVEGCIGLGNKFMTEEYGVANSSQTVDWVESFIDRVYPDGKNMYLKITRG